ncbi:SDR family oxidoreductase [Pseudopedobacter beijingensis]|uniref:SDR family oxidoreductase n=1 Tax=Pseudopedobacter beijingensis TaxID=1207056 RepID=A0ABW4IFW0_9SPHI
MNILITGASRGMGRAIARKMAENSANLALCARNYDELSALKQELEANNPAIKVFIAVVDCSKKEELMLFADNAEQNLGFIDTLINNVGLFKPINILDEEEDYLKMQMDVNLFAPYYLYKRLGQKMRTMKQGSIINICSVASKEAIVNAGSYCVTKAALLSLNNIMREELKTYDVKVTAILPGSTLTSSWDGVQIPADEFVREEDVAEVVHTVLSLSKGANVDEITIKPLHGQI